MPTQLTNPRRLARLCTLSFAKMARFRKSRMNLLRQYVGRMYGESATREGRAFPLTMIYQATTTIVPNLVYRDPKCRLGTKHMPYRPYAELAELAMDQLVEEINLRETLRRAITDSVFMAGFLKCGLGVSGQTLDINGFFHDIGQPYCDSVDPDDMLLDPIARCWEEQRFIGNRFRADLATLQDSGMYDPDMLKQFSSRYAGSKISAEASSLGGTLGAQEADSLVPAVDLLEIWIPSENRIITLPWTPGGHAAEKLVREIDYEGPEWGPYQMLGFAFAPDNILPVAPAMVWYDLHMMANKIARKIARQAERQKNVLAYEGSAWQDAQEIVDADDGESVRVDNIDAIKEVGYGGVNDDSYKYIEWAKQQFSEMAMNIDLLSGVGTDEATATQAEMVQANTTVRLSDMQSLVYQFTAKAMKHLFFLLHTDPLIELPLVKRVQGVDQQAAYSPEMREGDWIDYNITVRPYSMARQDPNLEIRRLLELYGNVIPAVAQAYQMLGPAFNIENALNIIARKMGIEELDEIINSQVLHMQLERMRQALEAGIPMDPKVLQSIMGGGTAGAGAVAVGGGRPGQPNPMAQLPAGITPSVESNMRRQDTAAELQPAAVR